MVKAKSSTDQLDPAEEASAAAIQEAHSQVARVLVVDDDQHILRSIQRILRSLGCDILVTSSGEEALEILNKLEIAVLICDEIMPGKLGTEVLKESADIQPDTIRILLTGSPKSATVIEAVNVSRISHFIQKPWEDNHFRQTVFTSLERYKLLQENQRLHGLIYQQHLQLSKNHEHLRNELKLGSRIHEVLLLSRVPTGVPSMSIDAMTVPSREIDGDFYDFYQPTESILDVVIGDVMGKGIPAALVGTAVKTQLMRFAVPFNQGQRFHSEAYWKDTLLEPSEILQRVQHETSLQLIDLGYFVSLFYARFNMKRHTVSFVDCGSTKPLHFQAKTGQVQLLKGTNYPIGMVDKDYYHVSELPFSEGDIFVFYSDGVTETKSPDNQLFGIQRLQEIICQHSEVGPTQLLRIIKHEVLAFARKDHFDDDLTIIIVQVERTLNPKQCIHKTARFFSCISQLEVARQFVRSVCQQAPGNAGLLSIHMELAINEIFCNIVNHGYEGKKGTVLLHAELGEDGVHIEISDQGNIFDPSDVNEPSLAGDVDHNFGLYIVRQIADEIGYFPREKPDGWNHLRIFKKYIWEKRQMDFSHNKESDVLVVTLEGDSLDAKEAPHFKDRVTELISSQNEQEVVFDMHRLQFIDSSGLGSLLSILRLLNTRHGDLKLARVPDPIKTMFEIVRMHKLFEIFNTTQDAVQSFK